eukprot:2236277-Pyramimonas_sp.AAC.1
MGPMWDYPPLAPRQPLSKYEICAVPPGTDTIDDPPGIAPTAKAYDTAQRPRTQSASASSAQQPIAPPLGGDPCWPYS